MAIRQGCDGTVILALKYIPIFCSCTRFIQFFIFPTRNEIISVSEMSHQKSKGEKSPAISQTTPSGLNLMRFSPVFPSDKPLRTEADDSVFDVADETVKSPSQAVDSKPTASDIQNDRSKQESDSTTGASDKKRKREESDTEGPAAKKTAPEHLIYVPPQYLTFDVMKECTRLAPPYIPSGKAATSKVIFDYAKFAGMKIPVIFSLVR